MDFCGFIHEVSTYLFLDFENRRQLVPDFVKKTHPTTGSYLNCTRIFFFNSAIVPREMLPEG